MTISRRATLAMLGGGAIAGGAGVTLVASPSDEDLVQAVLERHLGGFAMDRAELAAFLADFRDRQPWLFPSARLATAYGVAERLGLEDLLHQALPARRSEAVLRFERHLLAEVFARTDLAFRSSPQDPIVYLGSGACLNPFATFA